jgi:methylamine dehydrogenase heavy chain
MQVRKTKIGLFVLLALTVVSVTAFAEIKPEKLTIEKMTKADPHRLYLTDLNLNNVIDGRIHVLDGNNYKYLGLISTGMFGVNALSRDSSKMFVATTYYTKRNRGDRFDQFEVYRTDDLNLELEIEIPAKHAQALPYKGTITSSFDDKFVFIQNATPASSVSVINMNSKMFSSEISTPGCWIILPSRSKTHQFSTLCGDGTLMTITLDKQGSEKTKTRSEKIFHPGQDPLFVQAESIGDTYYFVSFHGQIYEVSVAGAKAKLLKTWTLLNDSDKSKGWRPGGYQLLAVHEESRRLYVAMHDNGEEGTHKYPAKEIWSFDIDSNMRVGRISGGNAIAMTLTKEKTPSLYVYDGMEAKFHKYSTEPVMKKESVSEPIGEFAGLIETH